MDRYKLSKDSGSGLESDSRLPCPSVDLAMHSDARHWAEIRQRYMCWRQQLMALVIWKYQGGRAEGMASLARTTLQVVFLFPRTHPSAGVGAWNAVLRQERMRGEIGRVLRHWEELGIGGGGRLAEMS
jgi:hypothetical protein